MKTAAAILCALLIAWIGVVAPAGTGKGSAKLGALAVSELPKEARDTLDRIRSGGPFPYPQDGVIFGNFERALPLRPRGYYREYTVPTPGARNRGARRIVAGRDGDLYYTDDHYNSFRRITE